MSEVRRGWSPDGVYHAVIEPVSVGMVGTLSGVEASAACGASCLLQLETFSSLSRRLRRCPACSDLVAKRAEEPDDEPAVDADPELHALIVKQMQEVLACVWACERDWDLDDRIDRSIRYGR
jgi:hypothetical protein